MVDFENEGQTHMCMALRICKHHTDMIYVSILTFSRPGISKMLNWFMYLKRLTLELEVIHIFHLTLLISGCMHAIDSILVGVDSNIYNVEYLRKPKISHRTLMVDFDFQGQTIFYESIIIFKVSPHSYIIYFRLLSSSTSIILKSIVKSSL